MAFLSYRKVEQKKKKFFGLEFCMLSFSILMDFGSFGILWERCDSRRRPPTENVLLGSKQNNKLLFCEFCEILRPNNEVGPFCDSVSHSAIRETTGPFYRIGTILHGVLIICDMMRHAPVVVAALHRLRLGRVCQTRYHSKNFFFCALPIVLVPERPFLYSVLSKK